MTRKEQQKREQPKAVERIDPDLQFAVLCDNVASGPGGKPVFVGVFDSFVKPGLVPQLFVVTRWVNGVGDHTIKIRVLNPELEPIFRTPGMTIKLRDKNARATTRLGFQNFLFPSPGVYWFEILLNERLALAIPVPVFEGS